jgi:peptidyl-prolyl cis-trans isomerase SurA
MAPVLKRALVATVPCLHVLSGCGVAGTQFHPGVAAQVGDETVTTDAVDELTADYCEAIEDQLQQPVPLSGYRVGIAALLTWKSAAEQLAERYGVTLSKEYAAQVAQYEGQADDLGLEGGDKEAFVEVQTAQAYVYDLLTQIGSIELEAEGQEDPTIDFQQARGQDELEAWIAREGVEFDPKYGLRMTEGAPDGVDTDLSFAAGDLATSALAVGPDGQPDAAYLDSLPASSTCG